MLKLNKYQQLILGFFASLALLLAGLAVLAISLFSANRQQAATIKNITPVPIVSPGIFTP